MLIPRGVLKIQNIAARDKTRYAMNGVLLDRDPITHEAIACATDGHRLLEARWGDEAWRSDFGAPINLEERARFFTVVPLEAIKASEKHVPKKGKPCFQYLAVDEVSANGTVKLATINENGPSVSEVKSIEGHFPPYLDVLPPEKGHGSMKIAFNARYLLELAEALHAARESGESEPTVILEIKDATSPINVRALGSNLSGVKTRAVLMPINHGEENDKPSEPTSTPEKADTKPKASEPSKRKDVTLGSKWLTRVSGAMVEVKVIQDQGGRGRRYMVERCDNGAVLSNKLRAASSLKEITFNIHNGRTVETLTVPAEPTKASETPALACPAELAPATPAAVLGAADLSW